MLLKTKMSSESSAMELKDTELTLCLPGDSRSPKRSFFQISLDAGNSSSSSISTVESPTKSEIESTKPNSQPTYQDEIVGWPPVRSWRKKLRMKRSCKYVKVGVDGTPYLRKVDLQTYNSYRHLLIALRDMFNCFTIYEGLKEWKLMDPITKTEYVPTYVDIDEDWMLLGDVPWKMFVESCKRLRLIRKPEPIYVAD